jgi:hypothetical protein
VLLNLFTITTLLAGIICLEQINILTYNAVRRHIELRSTMLEHPLQICDTKDYKNSMIKLYVITDKNWTEACIKKESISIKAERYWKMRNLYSKINLGYIFKHK